MPDDVAEQARDLAGRLDVTKTVPGEEATVPEAIEQALREAERRGAGKMRNVIHNETQKTLGELREDARQFESEMLELSVDAVLEQEDSDD